jgi:hypothetical protein
MRARGDGGGAAHQRDLVSSFTRRSVSITCRTSTILLGAATPVRHALAHFVQHTRDLLVPRREQPERRVERGAVGGEVGQEPVELGDRMRLVEAEDLARGVGP